MVSSRVFVNGFGAAERYETVIKALSVQVGTCFYLHPWLGLYSVGFGM
jgi:hypothetical protein